MFDLTQYYFLVSALIEILDVLKSQKYLRFLIVTNSSETVRR